MSRNHMDYIPLKGHITTLPDSIEIALSYTLSYPLIKKTRKQSPPFQKPTLLIT